MRYQAQSKFENSKRRRLACGVFLWAVLAWWFLFPPPSSFVEYWFSRRWYRWMIDCAAPISQSIPFPVALVLCVAGFAVFLAAWTVNWVRIRRLQNRSHLAGFAWGIRGAFLLIPALVVWFLAFWGAGYRRLPVEERLHLDTAPISDREAAGLQDLLLETVKRNLIPAQSRDAGRAIRSIALAMTGITGIWDGREIRLPTRVKAVPRGLLLVNGTSGVCAPFTLEALVDKGLPDTAFVYSAAHELGHLAGFCPEADASFAGYIAGLKADDAYARYSCALNAYMDLIARLQGDDFKRAFESLPEPARQDVKKADEAYWAYRIPWLNRISWQAYDRYLRAQGVREGVQSYSRGITLLGEAWRKGFAGSRQ
jgi:hypothetical protein